MRNEWDAMKKEELKRHTEQAQNDLFKFLNDAPVDSLAEFIEACHAIRIRGAKGRVEVDGYTAWVFAMCSLIMLHKFLEQHENEEDE